MTRTAKLAIAVLGSLVLLTGGVAAWSVIPAADGTITACMTKASGAIRLIDTATTTSCRAGEQKIEWNQKGVPGKDATEFVEYFSTDIRRAHVAPEYFATARCDVGDDLLWGNATIRQDPAHPNRNVSQGGNTFDSGTVEGWRAEVLYSAGSTVPGDEWVASIAARCADTAAPFDHPAN